MAPGREDGGDERVPEPRGSKDRHPEVAVGAVALEENSILLIRRSQPPSVGMWSLPGGRVALDETMADAVRREVQEETGLLVDVGDIAGVVERTYPDEGFHYVIVDYFVTVTGGDLRPGADAAEARWVDLQQIEALPLVPRLVEALKDFGIL